MNLAIVLLVCSLVGLNKADVTNQRIQPYIFENEIQDGIETFRQLLINGVPELGIPSFDPLNISALNINLGLFGNPNLNGTIALRSLTLEGIAGWDRPYVQNSLTVFPPGSRLKIRKNWPRIILTGDYDIDANIFGNTIVGKGPVKSTFVNMREEIEAQFRLAGDGFEIRRLLVTFSVESVEFQMGSLAINGEDFADRITGFMNNLPTFLKDSRQEIQERIDEIEKRLNRIIS